MKFNNTKTCAIQEIYDLRYHKTPEEAMEAFCKSELNEPETFVGWRLQPKTLYSFYMFSSGVPKPDGTSKDAKEYCENGGGFKPLGNYGTDFANFIVKNDLGVVTASNVVVNKAFHKDHANQVWLWSPDRETLMKWYQSRKTADELVKEIA